MAQRAKYVFVENELVKKFSPLAEDKGYKVKTFDQGSYPFFTMYEQQSTTYVTEKNITDAMGDKVKIAKLEESETLTIYETPVFFFNKGSVTKNDKGYLSKLGEYLVDKFGTQLTKPLFITFSSEYEDFFIPENVACFSILSSIGKRELNTNIDEVGIFYRGYQKQLPVKGVYKTWDEVNLAFDMVQSKHGFALSQSKRHTSSVLAWNISIDWEKFFSHPDSLLWNDDFWTKYVIPVLFDEKVTFAVKCQEIKKIIVNYRTYAAEYADKAKEIGTKEIKKLKQEQDSLRNNIDVAIQGITQNKRKMDENASKIISLEKELMLQNTKERLTKEFEATAKLVQNLELTDDGHIILYIEALPIDGTGPIIGPYKVNINVQTADIRIDNLGNPKEGHAHPHCQQGSKPCFGNYTDLYYHISKFELSTVVELIKVFLGTFNPEDSWGQYLGYWDKNWMFETYTKLGLTKQLEGHWNEDYKKWSKGKSLPEMDIVTRCSYCGEVEGSCTCEFCDYCGHRESECTCQRCSTCGARIEDCSCGVAEGAI